MSQVISGIVESISDYGGTVWHVGDDVIRHDLSGGASPTKIAGIFPGNGSWERDQPNGDTDAVWFSFEDGWMARPWLVEKAALA